MNECLKNVFFYFLRWLCIIINAIKTPGINDNTHLLDLSRLDFFLTEIQYWEIVKKSEKGIYVN